MHPELTLPVLGVCRAYPLAQILACGVGGVIAWRTLRRDIGGAGRRAAVAVGILLAVSVLGARVHYAAVHPGVWSTQGLTGAVLFGGRMHLAGGVIACALAVPIVARWLGLPALRFADALAPAVAVIFAGVRVACLLHGCCFGRPGTWAWCFGYPRGSAPWNHFVDVGLLSPDAAATMPLHPLPLYFVAVGGVVALAAARRRRTETYDGAAVLFTLTALSTTMLALEPLRADVPERVYWGPCPQLLWTAGAMTLASAVVWAWVAGRARSGVGTVA